MELKLEITLQKPPAGVDFGLQKGSGNNFEVIGIQRSGLTNLVFELHVEIKGDSEKQPLPDFKGPYVQGPLMERFIYINIGTYAGQSNSEWGRRLKIPLSGITWHMLLQHPMPVLGTTVPGTGKDGGPNCATVKPFAGWNISTASV